ncbi:MAG: nucleotidyl transferase AbiEii/AbiGii toxin family protein [Candidatus Thermoplasmatota archaeon]|nr:nucleotidyl transferase AbiEii/AbiGii toxin family protein [Candidatus Thermoplasmatota archaeon]MBU1940766.1 nucleotidyl transferase AbiEii/AbiGii toxin family protein [Candidatus Thermoplasmatota archaeon]
MDLDMLRLQAVKTGLGIKYLSKEERISILLAQLNELFPDDVILKGGTAFNRGYLYSMKRGRFSEDIDLDYYKYTPLDDTIKQIKNKMNKITEFDVSLPRILHRTLRFDCQYVNQLDEKDRVQVEFYLSKKKSAKPGQKMLLQSQYVPVSATLFIVYSLEDLIAQKLITLYSREEGKDMYDLFYGLDLTYDEKIVQDALSKLFIHYHINQTYPTFIKELIKKIDKMHTNLQYIANSTNHFIPRNLRPNWDVFMRMLKEKILANLSSL